MITFQPAPPARLGWQRQVRDACLRVSPLWPLHSFVAVNLYLGLAGRPFTDFCLLMKRVMHEGMMMSVEYFRMHQASGRISISDFENVIFWAGADVSVEDMLDWFKNSQPVPSLAYMETRRHRQAWARSLRRRF
jgi:hypothetical protein